MRQRVHDRETEHRRCPPDGESRPFPRFAGDRASGVRCESGDRAAHHRKQNQGAVEVQTGAAAARDLYQQIVTSFAAYFARASSNNQTFIPAQTASIASEVASVLKVALQPKAECRRAVEAARADPRSARSSKRRWW